MSSDIEDWESFTVEEWAQWTRDALVMGGSANESGTAREELHHGVKRFFDDLGAETKERFREGLRLLLESTQLVASNTELLYYLLTLLGYVKPLQGKRVLSRLIYTRALQELEYADQDLNQLAIVAYSAYGVDEELIAYLWRTGSSAQSLAYQFLCFRLIGSGDSAQATRFISSILPNVETEEEQDQLSRQLTGFAMQSGCSELYDWYRLNFLSLSRRFAPQAERLRRALSESVVPFLRERISDPYAVLLQAEALAGERVLLPKELVEIASAIHSVPESAVAATLQVIWELTQARLGVALPWSIQDSDSLYGIYRTKPPSLLIVGRVTLSIDLGTPEAALLEGIASSASMVEEEVAYA